MDCNPKIQAFIASPGLTRQYRVGPSTVRALDGLDLDVRQGEFLAVLGVSGSGKSRLLHLLGGLGTPASGKRGRRGPGYPMWIPANVAGRAGLDTPSSGRVAVEDPGTRCGSRRMWPAEPALRTVPSPPDAMPQAPGESGRHSRPYGFR